MSANHPNPEVEDRAREYFAVSGNCAQSTFAALNDEFGLNATDALKALTPMPGIAVRGDTCGAVVGSLAAVGVAYGRERLDDQEGMTRALKLSRRFCRWFEGEFGSTACREILDAALGESFNLAKPEEVMAYVQCGGPQHCTKIVTRSALETARIMTEAAV
jgi:C_GCAxxG_C_C family probable redox protein